MNYTKNTIVLVLYNEIRAQTVEIFLETRIHSSRMRTVRCLPGGCLPRGRVCVLGGVCPGGVCLSGGGVCLPARGVSARHPPGTEFLTHACENITFPQLRLRTATRKISLKLFRLTVNFHRGCSYRQRYSL